MPELTAEYIKQVFAYSEALTQQLQLAKEKGQPVNPNQRLPQPGDAVFSALQDTAMARAGLDSPMKVLNYINAPRGKIMKTLVAKQMAILGDLKFRILSELLEKRRALAFLKALLSRIEAKHEKKQEAMMAYNEAMAERMLELEEQAIEAANASEYETYYKQSLDTYQESLSVLEDHIIQRNEDLHDAEHEIRVMEEAIVACNDEYDRHLDDAAQLFKGMDLPSQIQHLVEQGKEHLEQFFAPQGKRLVKDDAGECYLLRPGQALSKLEPRQKKEAHEEYKRAKPDLQAVKANVEEERKRVTETHRERIQQLQVHCVMIREELTVCGQQFETIRMQMTFARMQLQQHQAQAQQANDNAAQNTQVDQKYFDGPKEQTVQHILEILREHAGEQQVLDDAFAGRPALQEKDDFALRTGGTGGFNPDRRHAGELSGSAPYKETLDKTQNTGAEQSADDAETEKEQAEDRYRAFMRPSTKPTPRQ